MRISINRYLLVAALIVAVLVVAPLANASSDIPYGNLEVKVLDEEGHAVPGALVAIHKAQETFYLEADANGTVVFENIHDGNWWISAMDKCAFGCAKAVVHKDSTTKCRVTLHDMKCDDCPSCTPTPTATPTVCPTCPPDLPPTVTPTVTPEPTCTCTPTATPTPIPEIPAMGYLEVRTVWENGTAIPNATVSITNGTASYSSITGPAGWAWKWQNNAKTLLVVGDWTATCIFDNSTETGVGTVTAGNISQVILTFEPRPIIIQPSVTPTPTPTPTPEPTCTCTPTATPTVVPELPELGMLNVQVVWECNETPIQGASVTVVSGETTHVDSATGPQGWAWHWLEGDTREGNIEVGTWSITAEYNGLDATGEAVVTKDNRTNVKLLIECPPTIIQPTPTPTCTCTPTATPTATPTCTCTPTVTPPEEPEIEFGYLEIRTVWLNGTPIQGATVNIDKVAGYPPDKHFSDVTGPQGWAYHWLDLPGEGTICTGTWNITAKYGDMEVTGQAVVTKDERTSIVLTFVPFIPGVPEPTVTPTPDNNQTNDGYPTGITINQGIVSGWSLIFVGGQPTIIIYGDLNNEQYMQLNQSVWYLGLTPTIGV